MGVFPLLCYFFFFINTFLLNNIRHFIYTISPVLRDAHYDRSSIFFPLCLPAPHVEGAAGTGDFVMCFLMPVLDWAQGLILIANGQDVHFDRRTDGRSTADR